MLERYSLSKMPPRFRLPVAIMRNANVNTSAWRIADSNPTGDQIQNVENRSEWMKIDVLEKSAVKT